MKRKAETKEIDAVTEIVIVTDNYQQTLSGSLDTDEVITKFLCETDFISLYQASPHLSLFKRELFWRRRLQQRHGEVPHPKTKTWKKYSLQIGYYNWNAQDWFSILGITDTLKSRFKDTLKDFFSPKSRIWKSGLIAATKKQDLDLIEFFIWKGADCWDEGLLEAVEKKNTKLVDFYIEKGADNFTEAIALALRKQFHDLAEHLSDLI